MNLIQSLFQIAVILLNVLWWIIIIQVILSWLIALNILNTGSAGVRGFLVALDRFTAPLYRPIRKFLPDFGGLDFSPLVILLLIMVLQKLLVGAAMDVATSSL